MLGLDNGVRAVLLLQGVVVLHVSHARLVVVLLRHALQVLQLAGTEWRFVHDLIA